MAYNFHIGLKDLDGVDHIVHIKRFGISDPVYDTPYCAPESMEYSHRGGDKGNWDESIIQGTEFSCRFFVPVEDKAIVEELMEADYGDYYLYWYPAGGPSIYFIGLLKPENTSVDYLGNPDYIEVAVSASDALSDLQHIDFKNIDGSNVTGRKTLLEVIQLATHPIHNLITYVAVMVNTIEVTMMSYGDCPLEKIYVNCERFFEENEKGTEYMSCYDVIEAILKPFSCKMWQSGGGLWIINYYENLVGYMFAYEGNPWTLINSVEGQLGFDISDNLFLPGIERQKIQPLKQIKTIFKNRDRGGDVTGDDLLSLSSWSHNFYSATITQQGWMQFHSEHNSTKKSENLTLNSDFSLANTAANYFIRVEMEYRIQNMVHSGGIPELMIGIQIKRPVLGGTWSPIIAEAPLYIMNDDTTPSAMWLKYDSSLYGSLQLLDTGNHNIRFIIQPKVGQYWDWTRMDLQIRSMRISKLLSGEQADYEPDDLSLDQDFIQQNETGVEKYETTVFFGDGNQITEVGALLDEDQNLTAKWSRLNYGEEIKLVDAYTRNMLANRSRYKNYLRLTVIDPEHNILIVKPIIMQGKTYGVSSYTRNIQLQQTELELVEMILEDQPS